MLSPGHVGFDAAMRRSELNNLLALLVAKGLVTEHDASTYCLELAELARGTEVAPHVRPYADLVARQYEDIASK